MLSAMRRAANTWVVRLLFVVLVASFGLWGIADVFRDHGEDDATVARIAGRRIDLVAAQAAYRRDLAQSAAMLGGNFTPTPELRLQVARQTVDRMVNQAAIAVEADRLGIEVPDEAVRAATFAMPAFRGPSGQFDRTTFLAILQRNNLNEAQFIQLIRADLQQRQLMGAVRAGVVVPAVLADDVLAYEAQTRSADAVELPFDSAPAPKPPTEPVLRRYWENHPTAFSTPEYRRIKAVILSTATIARDLDVSDADLHAAYDARRGLYQQPEKRSVQVLQVKTEAQAAALAKQWQAGATWPAMQAAAAADGGTGVALDNAAEGEFPDPALGRAVFAAPAGVVAPPVNDGLGWHVIKVDKVTPPAVQSFDAVKDALRQQIAQARAADLIYEREQKVQDALSGGAPLDQLPQGLGLAAVTGTLDAQGDTPDGRKAPIPAPPPVSDALIARAFTETVGEAPKLIEVPDPATPTHPGGPSAWYAVTVDSITKPALEPFDKVRAEVLDDWTQAARRHAQEVVAADLLTAVQGGRSLADAALKAGVTMRRLPPVGREAPVEGVPAPLVQPLFQLKKGEATMVETPASFFVVQLAAIASPDAKADPTGWQRVNANLARSLGDDLELTYVTALREQMHPRINQHAVDGMAQP